MTLRANVPAIAWRHARPSSSPSRRCSSSFAAGMPRPFRDTNQAPGLVVSSTPAGVVSHSERGDEHGHTAHALRDFLDRVLAAGVLEQVKDDV